VTSSHHQHCYYNPILPNNRRRASIPLIVLSCVVIATILKNLNYSSSSPTFEKRGLAIGESYTIPDAAEAIASAEAIYFQHQRDHSIGVEDAVVDEILDDLNEEELAELSIRSELRVMLNRLPKEELLNRFRRERDYSVDEDLTCVHRLENDGGNNEIDIAGSENQYENENNEVIPINLENNENPAATTRLRKLQESSQSSEPPQYSLTLPTCQNLLPALLPQNNRAWFFLGDSQMGKLVNHLAKQYPHPMTAIRSARDRRCGFLDYCYLDKSPEWNKPKWNQGPTKYGLENPFCSDISSAGNRLMESVVVSSDPNTAEEHEDARFMEFLIVDYTSDVEQQSVFTETTQETAVLHMANQLQLRGLTYEDSVCVVNAGLHDEKICANFDEEHCIKIYQGNVRVYLNMLHHVCGNILWVSLTPVMESGNFSHRRNVELVGMNEGARMALRKFENGVFLDVWEATGGFEHVDDAHFEEVYYQELAGLFANLM